MRSRRIRKERGLRRPCRPSWRKLRGIVVHHDRSRQRIGARITWGSRDHNSAQSPPATQAAMIVFTIHETTMLATHLLLFPHACFTPQVATRLMPCYGCQLKLSRRTHPTPLSNTNSVACHGKTIAQRCIFSLMLLGFAQNALPQLSSTPGSAPPAPPPPDGATVE